MPELFAGYHRLLSSLCIPSEKDIKHGFPKPGHIATLPILSQLGAILSGTVSYAYLRLHKFYNILENTSSINAATLAEEMTEVPDEEPVIILLISGKLTQTSEKAIFGYHLP